MRFALIADEVRVPIDSDADIVSARQKGRELASHCGFPSTDLAVVATAISELARNIVRYAVHGKIILRVVDNHGKRGIEVVATDDGPGIPDVDPPLAVVVDHSEDDLPVHRVADDVPRQLRDGGGDDRQVGGGKATV